ncbi:MAG TPA: DNA polymerase III subunit delta' [Acetobacteraceae bacterium]|nr:DNA polymerase III subunit delta' [Acetobacteraceae bacterium]
MPAPDPRANPLLLGHHSAEATLLEAMRAGRLHHAWLITGPDGVGKATLAYRFARFLLSGRPPCDSLYLDPGHPTFRRVAAASHADLLTIERAYDPQRRRMRTQIAVEDVRKINAFMALTPAEGGWRVVIVDGAEDMNANSANALLKVLEEPPQRAMLLLSCAAPGRLPATIRSRCRRLRLSPLPDDAMVSLLADYLPQLGADERVRLAALAEGSPGRALLLAEEEGLRIAALVSKVLADLPNLPPTRALDVADAIGRSETGFSTFMELLRADLGAAVREAVRGRADPEQLRVVNLRPLDDWGEVWQGLTRLQDETERFALDKRQALIQGLGLLSAGKMA